MNHHDLFSGFFGGAAGLLSSAEAMLHNAFSPKSDDITIRMDVSLADIYLGKKVSVTLDRRKGCLDCRGAGKIMVPCRGCHGNGIRLTTLQTYPGVFHQVPHECMHCAGSGRAGRGNCTSCGGRGVAVVQKKLDLRIPHDCRDGQDLIFEGLGHHLPGEEAGDAVVVFRVADHPTLSRRGCHLYTRREISLSEAICGLQTTLETLDGRKLLVRSGGSLSPGCVRVVEGEGMPAPSPHHRHMTYGNLYIEFSVRFPDSLDRETCEQLRDLMPNHSNPITIDRSREDVEEVRVREYDPASQPSYGREESEEEYDGPPGVQCVHQ